MLRTCYGTKNGDERMKEYAGVSERYAAGAHWSVLDDESLFNFGKNWQDIFDVLPEIMGCREHFQRWPHKSLLEDDYEILEEAFEEEKKTSRGWKKDPDQLLGFNAVARSLLCSNSLSWVWIVDKKAFMKDMILGDYFDKDQNVTVQSRVPTDRDGEDLDELLDNWESGCPEPPFVFDEGETGEFYSLTKPEGRKFFRLNTRVDRVR